ncbi:MAG: P-type DNA transfer ATPase VirB11 [Phyllobacterium sp.]
MSFSASLSDLIALAFAPLRSFLEEPDIIEICINQPGCVFVERARTGDAPEGMIRYPVPELTGDRIRFMAERVAAASHQFINEEEPLLSASLPDGARIQAVLPPAAPEGGAIVIRRQVARKLALADYARSGALEHARIADSAGGLSDDETSLCEILERGTVETFLREAVRHRVSIMISGGTGSGKTTFLNALMQEIPAHERIITIEDTLELAPPQANHVRLVATRGNQNIARIDPRHLVEASLRMRPDRLLLGEVRGSEAQDFLQAINTGHPGSLSTVHANSPQAAYTRLALLVMQSGAGGGMGLSRTEIVDTLRSTLPLVVQLGRRDGRPGVVTEIFYDPFVRHGGQVAPKSQDVTRQPSLIAIGRAL